MSFRFNNPLRQVANARTQINRGLGGFGQVQSALNNFNDVKQSISRISSSVGNISGNTGSIRDTITQVGSAGDLLNTLGGNSSISNTIRSVSALTGDIQSLVPGNSRVASQAATLSKKAEDLFANTQRNINSIQSITGGVTDVLNGSLDVGNLANRSLGSLTGGLNLESLTGGVNLNSIRQGIGSIGGGSISSQIGAAINNITANAPELKNITNKPLEVVTRSVAELTNPIGERYDSLRELAETQLSETSFDSFVDNTFAPLSQSPLGQFDDLPSSAFSGVRTGSGNSFSRVANPLRNYSSFNYVISLGILSSEEYNNPEVYRSSGGFQNYVIKSGGGQYDKRYQTFDEYSAGPQAHAEYFIDNLEMDAVIAPNPNTNVALGTALTFTVHEPYSMGNFIEAIIGSAAAARFSNYLDAPFCLRLDFVGWDEFGKQNESYVRNPIFIPIKLTKVDFNVDGKGAVYECKAVPMSETGLSDDINEIKTPVNINGDFVHTSLETGARSLTQVMNDRVSGLEEAGVIAPYDRYVIVFPKTRESLKNYLERDLISEDALRIDITERVEDYIGANSTTRTEELRQISGDPIEIGEVTEFTGDIGDLATFQAQLFERNQNIVQATISSVGRMYAKLKTFAEDTNEMNPIGLSTLVEDVATGGNQAHGSYAGTTDDEERGEANRDSADLAPAERSRDYQFNQGMTITEVIERMVVSSEYARDRATAPAQNGIRDWFKIDTLTFIEENPQTEAQIGRPPKVYVFSVIPYEADEAKFNAPAERPANTEGLKASAAKEYNYIYTGKNEDVLNFDISFNNAFLQTAFANFGQNAAGVASGFGTMATSFERSTGSSVGHGEGQVDPALARAVTGQVQEVASFGAAGFGDAVGSGDMRRRIAEMFHDRITNQVTDMVTAEMEIFGDPFFIPQEMGNFVARQGDSPNTTEEGTMAYQQSEVFIVVNFATPFDYQVEGATIEFPKVVPQFSGLFSCWAVTNKFNGGKFTQTLKLIRRRGQDDPATDENTGAVQESSESDITNSSSGGDGETGNTDASTAGSTVSPTTPNSNTAPPATPTSTGAGPVATNPIGRRFGSIDQAISAARSYQQNNAGFNYAVRQGENGGWTVGPRETSTTTATDLSSNVSNSAGTQSAAPTSPAC